MTVELIVKGFYPDDARALFERATHFTDLIEATRKISTYNNLPQEQMIEGRCYKTDINVFGLVKYRNWQIRIDKICRNLLTMDTSEFNSSVRVWKHRLQIKPTAGGSVWIDRVTLDAGAMTPVVARYARYMYKSRHATRRATSIDAVLGKSYRAVQPGLPLFQGVER